jgi:hypothetical protein
MARSAFPRIEVTVTLTTNLPAEDQLSLTCCSHLSTPSDHSFHWPH